MDMWSKSSSDRMPRPRPLRCCCCSRRQLRQGFYAICLAAVLSVAASSPRLWGLGLTHNSPTQVSLLTADSATGALEVVGFEPNASSPIQLAAAGDLYAVDAKRRVYYYLGDTPAGTTLVGLSLDGGAVVCVQPVALSEIQFVGIGQSLDYDSTAAGSLVLTGVAPRASNTTKATHSVYRIALGGMDGDDGSSSNDNGDKKCGAVTKVASFGVADYLPMVHGSTLDAASQRLFVDLAPSSAGAEVGVLDLATGKLAAVEPETPAQSLVGLAFDAAAGADGALVGVASLGGGPEGVALRSFDVATKKWTLTTLPKQFVAAGINNGEANTFDPMARVLYCTLYVLPAGRDADPTLFTAAIDVATATVLHSHQAGDVGICHGTGDTCLLQLAWG